MAVELRAPEPVPLESEIRRVVVGAREPRNSVHDRIDRAAREALEIGWTPFGREPAGARRAPQQVRQIQNTRPGGKPASRRRASASRRMTSSNDMMTSTSKSRHDSGLARP